MSKETEVTLLTLLSRVPEQVQVDVLEELDTAVQHIPVNQVPQRVGYTFTDKYFRDLLAKRFEMSLTSVRWRTKEKNATHPHEEELCSVRSVYPQRNPDGKFDLVVSVERGGSLQPHVLTEFLTLFEPM